LIATLIAQVTGEASRLERYLARVADWLSEHQLIAQVLAGSLLILLAYIADKIARRLLLTTVSRIVRGTDATWDDILERHRFFERLAHLAPAVAIYFAIELVPGLPDAFTRVTQHAALAAMVIIGALAGGSLLSAANAIYAGSPLADGRPIKGYVQVAKMGLYLVATIIAIATLIGESPLILLSGIGALTAVLLIVFRDTILSFVASLQISNYDMMRIGDWIEMPQYGADGDVVDIGLHTIKVQNWDKTIVAIPTHKFLSDSFKNWRGMRESGGRRIKRALHIDMSSIRFLGDEELDRFEDFVLLREYVREKRRELQEYNAAVAGDTELVPNARRLTNIGTFRAYVARYLQQHPSIHQRMTLMVRQLSPTPEGLPLEIYVFSNDVNWVNYEGIQSDIFDHIIAIVPEFGLRVFQVPSGGDFKAALGAMADATTRAAGGASAARH